MLAKHFLRLFCQWVSRFLLELGASNENIEAKYMHKMKQCFRDFNYLNQERNLTINLRVRKKKNNNSVA